MAATPLSPVSFASPRQPDPLRRQPRRPSSCRPARSPCNHGCVLFSPCTHNLLTHSSAPGLCIIQCTGLSHPHFPSWSHPHPQPGTQQWRILLAALQPKIAATTADFGCSSTTAAHQHSRSPIGRELPPPSLFIFSHRYLYSCMVIGYYYVCT